jgi:hypothetical protein
MAEPITFSFTPEKSDYTRTMRSFMLNNIQMLYVIGICIVLFIIGIFALFVPAHINRWAAILIVFLPWMLYSIFISPVHTWNKVTRDERLSAETEWQVDEQRIITKNKFAETSVEWSTYSQVYETKEHYLLIFSANKNMFQFIPMRAFTSPEQVVEFRKLLEEKYQAIRPLRLYGMRKSLLLGPGLIVLLLAAGCLILTIYSFSQSSR